MTATDPITDNDRWFLGTLLRLVADGSDTGGQLSIMHQRAQRGFSPPRHVHHREDTAMFVIDGRLTVDVGGEERIVDAGGFVWLPRDVPHTFRVDSDEVSLLELVSPAGFERFHIDVSEAAPRRELPPPTELDVGRIVAAIGRYGAEIVGPPMS